jgi:2-polyprenyl-6-hydroxyphenyl methylase/3-demethylubiquinone-9 3-methyltransferase
VSGHAGELARGLRFGFGANWRRFLATVDEARIAQAASSLAAALGTPSIAGLRFLDAGCGSGLFSLAARRLGASVVSFDYDPASVACAEELRHRFDGSGSDWSIDEGSVLDARFLEALGAFDVVYSWGVLHHTGALWTALELVGRRVKPGGVLHVSIYNDQGRASRAWLSVKRAYNRLPRGLRFVVLVPSLAILWGPRFAVEALRGHPGRAWRDYAVTSRGMSPWRDVVDWVGGLPFEFARPEEVFEFCRTRGFTLRALRTQAGGHGCNEFVFERTDGEG